jgi:hypothetical protein
MYARTLKSKLKVFTVLDILQPVLTFIASKNKLVFDIFCPVQSLASSSNRKWLQGRQLALMCCTDLCPFDIVERPGFVKYLLQNNVVKQASDLPSAACNPITVCVV